MSDLQDLEEARDEMKRLMPFQKAVDMVTVLDKAIRMVTVYEQSAEKAMRSEDPGVRRVHAVTLRAVSMTVERVLYAAARVQQLAAI